MAPHLKPKDLPPRPPAPVLYPEGRGGREVCDTSIPEGKAEYRRRVTLMWQRQQKSCCLCWQPMRLDAATFEHEAARGMNGGKRDDRIVLPDGTWVNGAAHGDCNARKGCKKVRYNHNGQATRSTAGGVPGSLQPAGEAGRTAQGGDPRSARPLLLRRGTPPAAGGEPVSLSVGEETFMLHCRAYGLTPVREHRLCEDRKWRFDFAWPEQRLAVEVEGGTNFGKSRHSKGAGFEKDAEKYNRAAREGWVVLRYSTRMVTAGAAIDEVREALTVRPRTQEANGTITSGRMDGRA